MRILLCAMLAFACTLAANSVAVAQSAQAFEVEYVDDTASSSLRTSQPSPPHYVIEAPREPVRKSWLSHSARHGESVIVDDSGVVQDPSVGEDTRVGKPAWKARHEERNENISRRFVHADKLPPPMDVPGATRVPVWKQPYSYGYFGATHNRQWSHHHGYRQNFSQWTLR